MKWLLVLLLVIPLVFTCEDGDPCSTRDGETGVIVTFEKCRRSRSFNSHLERPCAFIGKTPLICCELSHVQTPETSTTTSTMMSLETTEDSPGSAFIDIADRFTRKVTAMCNGFGKRPDEPELPLGFEEVIVDRVINGEDCEPGEIPHFASVGYRNNENDEINFACAGALISENFALTAAHCCKKTSVPALVRLGKVRN